MKKYESINLSVVAESGSKLEQAILQSLKDVDANRKRLREEFKNRKEKQVKKIERRL